MKKRNRKRKTSMLGVTLDERVPEIDVVGLGDAVEDGDGVGEVRRERGVQREMKRVMRKWSCSPPLRMIWAWTCSRLGTVLQAARRDGSDREDKDGSVKVEQRLSKVM
ncbi:pentatricopeptide repeat (PPR-like) superfamily protein [Actinidia rufa]|uniref:Pentatricopeptide repeat (PPR-like) superfamily protein n=1 Tax=Actinidia rufa TaxID=165716 RepID=A0A7J0GKH9_9ERIC|nr:pentatricopeptide repeat (PPR-like) superfamily protein [Actinidia rufa]